MLRLRGKVLKRRIKTHPAFSCFTLCLPGSPKVNAGGACGAWLPGRELVRISAITDRIEGTLSGRHPRQNRTSRVPKARKGLRASTRDEFAQWMVQDASPGRYDRWGP